MTTKTCDVKKDGNVIGTASFPHFDSLETALSHLGDKDALAYINARVKQNACSAVRMAVANDSPEKQISRISRDIRKGKVSKADGASQLRALLEQLV